MSATEMIFRGLFMMVMGGLLLVFASLWREIMEVMGICVYTVGLSFVMLALILGILVFMFGNGLAFFSQL